LTHLLVILKRYYKMLGPTIKMLKCWSTEDGLVFSAFRKIVYRWVTTNFCSMSDIMATYVNLLSLPQNVQNKIKAA
jgi:hypothetical protein